MKIAAKDLIDELVKRTERALEEALKLRAMDPADLNRKENPESWSVLECIEHLNLYGDFYLPEIEQRIKSSPYPPERLFKSGLLGNYFAKSMLPGEKMKKMKTFKDKDPGGNDLDISVLERFAGQQEKTLDLLEKARKVSLTRTKTSISISSWIKLSLGDTLRVVIYHNHRHLVQAHKVLERV